MIFKIEALKGNYAAFDQAFTDRDAAYKKFEELNKAGWKVQWTQIPVDPETYYKRQTEQINAALNGIYGGDNGEKH